MLAGIESLAILSEAWKIKFQELKTLLTPAYWTARLSYWLHTLVFKKVVGE
jgi:hypothetical protein